MRRDAAPRAAPRSGIREGLLLLIGSLHLRQARRARVLHRYRHRVHRQSRSTVSRSATSTIYMWRIKEGRVDASSSHTFTSIATRRGSQENVDRADQNDADHHGPDGGESRGSAFRKRTRANQNEPKTDSEDHHRTEYVSPSPQESTHRDFPYNCLPPDGVRSRPDPGTRAADIARS
jgi:hypothetical protein